MLAVLFVLCLFLSIQWQNSRHLAAVASSDYAHLVNPFTGTGVQRGAPFGGGNTFPGADVPFGMVQWSPDTATKASGSYVYNDHRMKGFGLTHLSGAGCNTFEDFPFMPYSGTLTNSPATHPSRYFATFSHAHETAYAGYYKVKLNNGITTELTATQRTGIARFTYPAGSPAALLINVSGSANGVSRVYASISENTISGSATSTSLCFHRTRYTLYFFARFSQPFASFGTWEKGTVYPRKTLVTTGKSGVYVTFNTTHAAVILASVGLSFVSIANAQSNLNTEDPTGNFDTVLAQAVHTWNAALGKIQVSGGTFLQTSTFYTALYHSLLFPNVFSDDNGQYIGFDKKVHTVASGHIQYANFSGWDIYRSEAQLLAFLLPEQASDMAQSLVNDYKQNGMLPKWSQANGDGYLMVGDPADAIIADIYAFGGTNFDTSTALAAMVQQATQPNAVRDGLSDLLKKGYLPLRKRYICCNRDGQAAMTLEYNTADFAISAFAQALGDTADYRIFLNRAQDWQNLLNSRDHYLEPRFANGRFLAPYNPRVGRGWIEGDEAQYTWMVPFNLAGLFQAMGGKSVVIGRLNLFFTRLNGGPSSPYAFLGNEPSLETPWEYDYAGVPYLTQSVVRRAENTLFSVGPGGLPGNDDLGETSSWYIWAALGMFPETPGTANLVLTSPLFARIVIQRPGGQTITINASNASASTYYIQNLTVNGAISNSPWLPPAFLVHSGTLNYTLSARANTNWGATAATAPPSYGSVPNTRSGYPGPR